MAGILTVIYLPESWYYACIFDEKVDFIADFEAAFGYPAPAPSYIAISGDADDTESVSEASIVGIIFGNE